MNERIHKLTKESQKCVENTEALMIKIMNLYEKYKAVIAYLSGGAELQLLLTSESLKAGFLWDLIISWETWWHGFFLS